MPLTLKIDPWDPAYESALQLDDDATAPVEVDPFVETKDWSAPPAPVAWPRPEAIAFIDGVQRVDSRVIGDDSGQRVYGAFSSLAVGAVITTPSGATLSPGLPERVLALTGGASFGPVDIACGRLTLRFQAHSTAVTSVAGVHEALSSARQAAETRFGERLADEGYPLVVVDGPIGFWPPRHTSVVGLVKTIHKQYLAGDQAELLSRLGPGERTPIFRIGRDRPAFSWYLRLSPRRPIEHPWAGIVRLEAMEFVGLEATVRLAGLTARHLPDFASSPIRDPRAPQNLYPIGALEQRLRRQLGDPEFIRRSIEAHFYRHGVAA
ncbi:MAG TPA: DNA double-strand break repair nuclease NurA [Dehalococcoidia bacterium]|nr:DNA double-strand break repair nuclease NurA [Dehalococcoidia bacterium]